MRGKLAVIKYPLVLLLVWAVLVINIVFIAMTLYQFRYAIYCGLGIGNYALLIYGPIFIFFALTYLYKGMGLVVKARNFTLIANGMYIALLIIEGGCFSCVNTCVEYFQK